MINKKINYYLIGSSKNILVNLNIYKYYYNKFKGFKVIVTDNLKLIKNDDLKKNIKIIKKKFNFDYCIPKKEVDLNTILKQKNLILINNLERSLNNFKILRLIKSNRIRQIRINNFGNIQGAVKKKFFIKYVDEKIYNFFLLLNIFQRIDIRFISNKKYIQSIEKSKIKSFLHKKNFFYYKKNILVNSIVYDQEKREAKKNNFILHLDYDPSYHHEIENEPKIEIEEIKSHYKKLNDYLLYLSKIFKKKVIVSLHPLYNEIFVKKFIKNFEIKKFKTENLIRNASIITHFSSSAIMSAIINKKKIINLKSDYLNFDTILYAKQTKTFFQDIRKEFLSKEKLDKEFKKNDVCFDNYIKNYHFFNNKNVFDIIENECSKLLTH